MLEPVPLGMYADVATSTVIPFQSAVMLTGEVHVFAMNIAKHPPCGGPDAAPSASMTSGSTA